MKKQCYFMVLMFLILCLAGCHNIESTQTQTDMIETIDATTAQMQFTEKETIGETIADRQPSTDYFDNYAPENNLNSQDLEIVRTLYDELKNYFTINNSTTEHYTRKDVYLSELCIVYSGSYPIVVGYYPIETNMITVSWKMNENGTLTDIDFDMDEYTEAHTNKSGFIDMSTITNAIPFGQMNGEKNNIKWLCYTYAEYKEKRQEKFGDLSDSGDTILESLDDSQKEMLDNILKYCSIWENYYNSWEDKEYPCIYISVWSFGDGTAEILCTHGTIDFHNEKSTQYRGTNHGYSISKDSCLELDKNATERLKRDLSSQSKLYWSNDWIYQTKEIKLAEYILEISY